MQNPEDLTRAQVAQMIDHTLLTPEATAAQVDALVEEGQALGVRSVCFAPTFVGRPGTDALPVTSVVGFPTGAHTAKVKAFEAAHLADGGADEIDMVINLGAAKEGRWEAVEEEVRAVREAAPDVTLKVIIESGALTDNEIVAACRAAEGGGADFVKTSTGFHPAGGATVHAVALMRRTVGDRLGVKASGGIRTAEDAAAMIDAGASRLGTSATRTILDGWPRP